MSVWFYTILGFILILTHVLIMISRSIETTSTEKQLEAAQKRIIELEAFIRILLHTDNKYQLEDLVEQITPNNKHEEL